MTDKELLQKLANWLDPMHLVPPCYEECCEAYETIIKHLSKEITNG